MYRNSNSFNIVISLAVLTHHFIVLRRVVSELEYTESYDASFFVDIWLKITAGIDSFCLLMLLEKLPQHFINNIPKNDQRREYIDEKSFLA